jgi:hypothetical protein
MPVEGLPDRKIHRLCWGCRRWFHLDEGVLDYPFAKGPMSMLLRAMARSMEDERKLRFYCTACHESESKAAVKREHAMKITLYLLACLMIAIALAFVFDLVELPHFSR